MHDESKGFDVGVASAKVDEDIISFQVWNYIAPSCNVCLLIIVLMTHAVINLSRCNTDIETFGLIMHELMHMSFDLHTDEEELITWAENESLEVFNIIKHEHDY